MGGRTTTRKKYIWIVGLLVIFVWIAATHAQSPGFKENIYPVGKLKPTDSVLIPNWNPVADINGDGVVNIIDLVAVALHFGEEY